MTSGTFMMTCRKQKWWEICFNRLKLSNKGAQTVKSSYHKEQHADYLQNVIFCMTAPFISISDSTKFKKYIFFLKYFPCWDF